MATENPITDIETFAEQFRLTIRRDECNDQIIPGKRGRSQLYFDGPELCLMVLDGKRVQLSRWYAVGGKLWVGDISEGVQDVKITRIPPSGYRAAIRLARCRHKPDWTAEQKAACAAHLKSAAGPIGSGNAG